MFVADGWSQDYESERFRIVGHGSFLALEPAGAELAGYSYLAKPHRLSLAPFHSGSNRFAKRCPT